MRNMNLLACLLLGLTLPAYAEDASTAKLTFEFSGLRWYSTKIKDTTPAVDTEKRSTSLFAADLLDSLIRAQIDQYKIYFYPFQDANTMISLGYQLTETLELGIDLGVNTVKHRDPKIESDSKLFGVFANYEVPFSGWTLNNFGVIDLTSNRQTYLDIQNSERTLESRGSFFKLSSQAFIPLAKNAWYFAGIWYAISKNAIKGSDGELQSRQFGITLAGLRITVGG